MKNFKVILSTVMVCINDFIVQELRDTKIRVGVFIENIEHDYPTSIC